MLCLSTQWIPKLFCIVSLPHAPILGIQLCQPLQIPLDFQNFMSLGQKVLAHPLIVNQTAMYTNRR